jgi:hypothetical protein
MITLPADFSTEKLIQAVRALAEKSPDNVYEADTLPGNTVGGCRYASGGCQDGSKGCLIGQAFARCGIDPSDLDARYPEGAGVNEVLGAFPLNTRHGMAWLAWVQDEQDNGSTWREAVSVEITRV